MSFDRLLSLLLCLLLFFFFFSSRRRHTRCSRDWSSDVCSSDLVTLVRKGIGTDRRIGPAFLFPGPGYGGSCFPKDVKALIRTGEDRSVSLDILHAVEAANERQKRVLFEKLARRLGDGLRGATVAVWGLAFKAETDDVRESPALVLVEQLLAAGAPPRRRRSEEH